MRPSQHTARTKKTGAGGRFTWEEWEQLCAQADFKCVICHERRVLVPDHIVPVAHGGTSNIDNIQPLCRGCNGHKGGGERRNKQVKARQVFDDPRRFSEFVYQYGGRPKIVQLISIGALHAPDTIRKAVAHFESGDREAAIGLLRSVFAEVFEQ